MMIMLEEHYRNSTSHRKGKLPWIDFLSEKLSYYYGSLKPHGPKLQLDISY